MLWHEGCHYLKPGQAAKLWAKSTAGTVHEISGDQALTHFLHGFLCGEMERDGPPLTFRKSILPGHSTDLQGTVYDEQDRPAHDHSFYPVGRELLWRMFHEFGIIPSSASPTDPPVDEIKKWHDEEEGPCR